MKNKLKNLFVLALSSLVVQSSGVFAMKQGGRPGYGEKDLVAAVFVAPQSNVPPSHIPPKLRKKIMPMGEKTVCVTADALSYQSYFDSFINNLNSMNETVIRVKLPDGMNSNGDIMNRIRTSCPGKTVNFV